jgi:hypothetical protein
MAAMDLLEVATFTAIRLLRASAFEVPGREIVDLGLVF